MEREFKNITKVSTRLSPPLKLWGKRVKQVLDWHQIGTMDSIKYITGNKLLLDRIQNLWEQLNLHHADVSEYFSNDFLRFSFNDRKSLLDKVTQNDDVFIEIAFCIKSQLDVGYCISSINSSREGEIDSIFIKQDYRGHGIGEVLITQAITWFDSNNIKDRSIAVAYGNEKTFKFYSRFGFYPRLTLLKQRS